MIKSKLILFLVPLMILLTACNKNTVYKEYSEIPDKIWDRSFMPEFETEIEDTSKYYNINIHVRNASIYPYANIWLFIHKTSPTGKTDIDTLECILANESGKWLGEGMGDIWDNEIPWIKNYKFEQKGKYSWKIEQGMRNAKLPGIMDIGMSIKIPDNQ